MDKKIEMIVTDLDRSLLHTDKTISEYTKNVFEKCRNKNFIIVFATARPIRSVKIFLEYISPNAVIYHNGAIIVAGQKKLNHYYILPKTAKELLETIEKNYSESTLSVEMDDTMYTNFDLEKNIEHTKINFRKLPEKSVEKIIIGNLPVEKIKEIEKYLSNDLYLEINDGRFGFIMNKKASKWNGIKILSEYYKIGVEKIIAFGDDLNDFEMIKNCGVGIAMKNGLDEIKTIADYICENNDNDGIAKWIKEEIL